MSDELTRLRDALAEEYTIERELSCVWEGTMKAWRGLTRVTRRGPI